ncbi:MAG: lysophospholipid acyltransferase family protein [Haloechinothrix sp.]
MAHAWMPTSPCGDGCLDSEAPRVGLRRAACRLLRAAGVLIAAVIAGPALFLLSGARRERFVRWIFEAILQAFEVRMVVHGGEDLTEPPERRARRGALVVNNHISWLDIVAVNAVQPMRALAKKEIAGWPVLGGLVSRAGTVYVDRERLSTLPATVGQLGASMRAGSLVNVCAEGTTLCGRELGRFAPAPFQAAIDAGVPVRPIALRYRIDGGPETTQPAFIGVESLLASVGRVALLRDLVIEVFVCPEIAPGRGDRKELAALAESAVRSARNRRRWAMPLYPVSGARAPLAQ